MNRLRNQSFPAHLHRAYELIYVQAGTLSLQVEQKRYLLEPGDLAFLFCNQIHSFTTPETSDVRVVLFSPEMIGDFYSAYKDYVPENNIIRPRPSPDFSQISSLYAQKGLLYRLCDVLLASTAMDPVGGRSHAAVLQQIFAYVDRHFSEDCSLKAVARSMQYDYAYLSKLFTRLTGMRFTEYLNNYRIAQSCYLLKAGKGTVSEIAALCGYSTLRTFHRNFHTVLHCSPKLYLAQSLTQGVRWGDAANQVSGATGE